MFEPYENYLEKLNSHLEKFFSQQKPYIFCEEGCSKCCEKGIFPFTKLEFDYIKQGLDALLPVEQDKIYQKINEIKAKKDGAEKFFYCCPFLENNKCTVYKHRAIECRCYGLTRFYTDEDGTEHYTMPACVDEGLNYSNVFDFENCNFSQEKVEKVNSAEGEEYEPQSYNLGLRFLTTSSFAQGLDFGESKALIDWFD